MRLPFTKESLYVSKFSFEEIVQELENKNSIKYFAGLRVDKYEFNLFDTGFYVRRYSNGIDALLEYFPVIKGEIVSEKPTTVLLTLKPNYFAIIFFSLFIFVFGFAGIFVDNWTINGVKRIPTAIERLFFVLGGSGVPFLMCYFQNIRPIEKAEKWIIEKLGFVKQQ